jgi:hypothetical protein
MKKKSAVFTIVKNENYFLSIWIKHYKKYFDVSDIYVLDHQSNDGSTDNINVNVVPVINELAFDHQWLVNTVQDFQKELLEKYECVLFAEADELLYTLNKNLNESIDDFLNDSSCEYVSCYCHEVVEDLKIESELSFNDKIFEKRNYWFRDIGYDKTLLSKIPLNWCWGFHTTLGLRKNYKYSLYMVHLHRVDFEMMLKRHEERATKWKLKDDGAGAGFQHKIGDREGVMNYFKEIPSIPELIPIKHKIMLEGI